MERKIQNGGGKKPNPWHTAFFQAVKQELFEYRDSLEFENQYPLTNESLRIDVLVIKKPRDKVIEKNIARIFRADNILEYKSPRDYLAVTDFLKVNAYANLYAAITPSVDFAELSLTFVENRHPRKLLQYLTEIRGYAVEETSPGIYLVTGDYLPIQVIESGKLPERENLWLKSLVNDLKAVNADGILNEIEKSGNKAQLGAYLDVIIRANPEAFLEAINMARKKRETFEEVFTRAGLIPEWLERGRIQGREQGLVTAARNAMSKGLPIDMIHDITGLDIETIQALQMNP
jgi:hypothetical protein